MRKLSLKIINKEKPIKSNKKKLTLNDIQKPQKPQYANVMGKVVKTNNKIFHIYAETMNKNFECICDNLFPIREGDVIVGIAEYDGKTLRFNISPFTILAKDKGTLLHNFMISLRGTKSIKLKSFNLMDILIDRYNDLNGVIRALDDLACKYCWGKSED